MGRPLGSFVALVASGAMLSACYRAHSRDDETGVDGALRSDAAVDTADPCIRDGARLCDLDACPVLGTPDCQNCICPGCIGPGGHYPGVCVSADGTIDTTGCARDRVVSVPPGIGLGGRCDHAADCFLGTALGVAFDCYYMDGTSVTTGVRVSEPCPGIEDIACGPGCAMCATGTECFGTSERSGLGYCVAAPADDPNRNFVRRWCGFSTNFHMSMSCSAGARCLRFATPPDIRAPLVGTCVPPGMCARLAAARPDRFACE